MAVMRAALVFALVLVAARTARAEDARIAAARAAYFNGDHDKTVAALTPILPSLREPERARALRLIGCAHMVLGDRPAAIRAFRESFALEADAALDPDLAT